ncbi:MAG: hypothetical protein QM426_01160 [Euryarchaeota archaeon]|nr:hypothetical protein [Euryarchaeota archaeon]
MGANALRNSLDCMIVIDEVGLMKLKSCAFILALEVNQIDRFLQCCRG